MKPTNESLVRADRHMLRRQLITQGLAAFAASRKRREADPISAARLTRDRFAGYYGDLKERLRGPLRARQVGGGTGAGFRYENLLFESHEGWEVNATLYLPADVPPPWPAVVVSVGHSGKQFSNYQLPPQYFARAGLAALVYDPPGMAGEKRPGNDHFRDGVRCYLTGDTSSRYFVGDALRALDYLATRSDIDQSHGFACTGVSGGGHTSVFAALLDDRVTAIAPSCCMGPQEEHVLRRSYSNCPETLMIGRLHDGIEDRDLLRALAPRPLLLMAGQDDEVYRAEESRELAEQLRADYAQLGAAGNFEYFEDASGHAYSLAQARTFTRWLRGCWHLPAEPVLPAIDDRSFQLLPAAALQCHPNPDVNMRSLTSRRAVEFATHHVPPGREQLAELAGITPDLPAPSIDRPPGERTWFHVWTEATVTTEPGIAVPVTHVVPVVSDATLWHFDPAGRSRLVERGGLLMDAIGHLDRSGPKSTLLAVDLRGWGDTAPAFAPFENVNWGGPDRFVAYVSASLADPVEAGRLRDAWQVMRAIVPTGRNILHAVGAAGPVALHLAVLTQAFDAVVLHAAPGSYADLLATDELNWPHDLILPGVLRHYDLPLLATAAGCPVYWLNPQDGAGTPLSAAECARRTRASVHWRTGVDAAGHLALLRQLLHG